MNSSELSKPHVIAIVGLPGAGKTHFATKFSEMFGAPYLDFSHYTYLIADKTSATELSNYTFKQMLRTNHTVIIEGMGDTKKSRESLVNYAKRQGYSVLFVWVQIDRDTALYRSVEAKGATLSREVYDQRVAAFENIDRNNQRKEPHVVISGKHNYSSQAKIVLKKLAPEKPVEQPEASVHASVRRFRGRLLR